MNSILDITSRNLKPLPKFLELPEKYKCVRCNGPLQGPSQTSCGHRICNACLGELLTSSEPQMCPGNEDGCVLITEEEVSSLMQWLFSIG